MPTNAKLHRRAAALTMRATGADETTARRTLEACGHSVKVAIVALLRKTDAAGARADIVLVSPDLNVCGVWIAGNQVR
jgi:N-acetylmuramic acid 6-phosphate etherase